MTYKIFLRQYEYFKDRDDKNEIYQYIRWCYVMGLKETMTLIDLGLNND